MNDNNSRYNMLGVTPVQALHNFKNMNIGTQKHKRIMLE